MFLMHLPVSLASVHGHVVHIDSEIPAGYQVAEQRIHHGLEGHRRVAESEEHHRWLIQPVVGRKGGLPFMALLYPHRVIPLSNVELRKEGAPSQTVSELGD